jgi:hypothetical protein
MIDNSNVTPIADLTEKAVIVRHTVTGRSYGRTKQDKNLADKVASEHGAQKGGKAVKASKVLIDPSFTEKLGEIGGKAYQAHIQGTLPWDDEGYRILPTANYFPYMAEQGRYRDQYRAAVADFEAHYPDAIEDAQRRLGDLFDRSNYMAPGNLFARHPTTDQYLRFCVGHPQHGIDIQPLPSKADIRVKMHGDEVSRIQAQIEARVQRTVTMAMQDLWGRLRAPIETLATRLGSYNEGDIKRFESAWIENVRAIVEIVPKLNLTGDAGLIEMVADAQHLLLRWNADQMRVSKPTREMVKDSANAILAKMAGYCGMVPEMDLEEAA